MKIGIQVWYWSPYRKKGESGSLAAKWSGPWKVTKIQEPVLITITSEWYEWLGMPERELTIHVDRLKLYKHGPATQEALHITEDVDKLEEDPNVDIREFRG